VNPDLTRRGRDESSARFCKSIAENYQNEFEWNQMAAFLMISRLSIDFQILRAGCRSGFRPLLS
jgi:hypothetical protein